MEPVQWYSGRMTTNKKPKKPAQKSKQTPKPLVFEVHGDGVDIRASFQGSTESGAGRKKGDNAWSDLIQQLFGSLKVGAAAQAGEAGYAPVATVPNLAIESAAFLIRVASPTDLEVIHAAIRARAEYDARESAAKAAASADVSDAEIVAS